MFSLPLKKTRKNKSILIECLRVCNTVCLRGFVFFKNIFVVLVLNCSLNFDALHLPLWGGQRDGLRADAIRQRINHTVYETYDTHPATGGRRRCARGVRSSAREPHDGTIAITRVRVRNKVRRQSVLHARPISTSSALVHTLIPRHNKYTTT